VISVYLGSIAPNKGKTKKEKRRGRGKKFPLPTQK